LRVAKRIKGAAEIEKKNQALERLEITYVPANSIRPNSYNPNRQSDFDFELLIKSMTEDGFTQPIVCQQESREFVDGEHRWTAWIVLNWLRRKGIPVTEDSTREARSRRLELLEEMPDLELPVVFTTMTPEQMRIATLRHNRARGSEDVELAAAVLRDLQKLGALDWAQDSLMLDDVEVDRLLADIQAPEALAGEEFQEAWVPEPHAPNTQNMASGTTEAVVEKRGTYTETSAMSAAAVESARKREVAIAQAKTEEERQQAIKEREYFRLALMFSDEEAVIVKGVLGNRPAEVLLEICRAFGKSEGEDPWVPMPFRLPESARDAVQAQVERLRGLLNLRPGCDGLALERMAILTATTPDDELSDGVGG